MAEPIFLVSTGRSGSHMLRGFLEDGYSAIDFGEVFNDDGGEKEHGFFRFLVEEVRRDPGKAIPTKETQKQRFDDYIRWLSEAAGAQDFIIDFKYGQSHHFDAFWHQPGSTPTIIRLIIERGHRVLHLVRKNMLATRASTQFARANNVWVNRTTWHKPELREKVTIDVETIRRDLSNLLMCIRYFNDCLGRYPRLLGLYYEDMLLDGKLNPVYAMSLAEFLNQPVPPPLTPTTRKIAPRLEDYIENYDEVIAKLAGTPFAEMAAQ
jgi:hypothetical protein